MKKKEIAFRYAIGLAAYIIVVWGFYRLLFKLPDEVEEGLIKPLIWLVPTFVLVYKEKSGIVSLGLTLRNLFPSIYLSLALGTFFVIEAVVVNYVKYGSLNFGANVGQTPLLLALGLTFVTAVSEEITFRGYIFQRVLAALDNEIVANLITSFAWGLVHVPITFFVWKMTLESALLYLGLTVIFGMGSAFLIARTKNVASSIFLHVLWQWPIILFR